MIANFMVNEKVVTYYVYPHKHFPGKAAYVPLWRKAQRCKRDSAVPKDY